MDDQADGRTDRALVERARGALERAHVPYSDYRVGAALEATGGDLYLGCNVENANYSNSLHAEEVAVAEAVKDGRREFERLAVASGARDGVTPCGMCRQTLVEFCDPDLRVICDEGTTLATYALGDLLPAAISEGTLDRARDSQRGTDTGDR